MDSAYTLTHSQTYPNLIHVNMHTRNTHTHTHTLKIFSSSSNEARQGQFIGSKAVKAAGLPCQWRMPFSQFCYASGSGISPITMFCNTWLIIRKYTQSLSSTQNYLIGSRPKNCSPGLLETQSTVGEPKDPAVPISSLRGLSSDSFHLRLVFKLLSVIYLPCRLCMAIFQSRLSPPCQSTNPQVNRLHQPAGTC